MHTSIARPRSGLFVALLLLPPALTSAQEICDNALDDDADGLVDLNDTLECVCEGGPALIELDLSIQNPSFEVFSCCPSSYSQMSCAVGWSQATYSSSDYFNQCDYFPDWIPTPLPSGGQACIGGYQVEGYQEYAGTCLTSPLQAGEWFTVQVSVAAFLADNSSLTSTLPIDFGPVDLVVWGLPTCPSWPVPTSICPESNGWVPLGSSLYVPSNDWQEVSITISAAQEIHALIIGAPCDLPEDFGTVGDPDAYYPYFLFDEVRLFQGAEQLEIQQLGALCSADAELVVPVLDEVLGYQWYLDGVALPGQTSESTSPSDEGLPGGTYACRLLWPGDSCSLLTYTLTEVPPVPVIVQSGVDLTCLVPGFQPWELAYLWYLNGTLIPGAAGSSLVAQENGAYSVVVVTFGDCAGISTEVLVSTVGLSEAGAPPGVSIRTLGDVVEVQGLRDEVVILFDATGRVVAQGRASAGTWRHVLAPAADGLYVLSVGGRRVRLPVVRP